MKCPKCGAEMPEHANFCTKCGEKLGVAPTEQKPVEQAPVVEQTQQPVVKANPPAVTEQQRPKQSSFDAKKANDFLTERFMPMYVITGVLAYVLTQLSALFVLLVSWLSTLLGIFSILCAVLFALLGTVRFLTFKSKDGKRTNTDIICFAIGIILFLFVLVTNIVVLGW